MKPKIVHARDKKVMDQLMELFIESKYKIQSSDWNYVLLKRNYYGNYYIHIVSYDYLSLLILFFKKIGKNTLYCISLKNFIIIVS